MSGLLWAPRFEGHLPPGVCRGRGALGRRGPHDGCNLGAFLGFQNHPITQAPVFVADDHTAVKSAALPWLAVPASYLIGGPPFLPLNVLKLCSANAENCLKLSQMATP